jgi:hypothetical protein
MLAPDFLNVSSIILECFKASYLKENPEICLYRGFSNCTDTSGVVLTISRYDTGH